EGGANGVLLSLGGRVGGWSLYLKDGKPAFAYNLFGITTTHVRSESVVPAGEHQVRVEFAYDGGGISKGGNVTLYLDGNDVGSGRVEHTQGIGFGYEYTDVGRDAQSPVTDDYPAGPANAFSGTIKWMELEGGEDSHDHLIPAEDFVQVAFARQ
ncbi:MAG TPA: hypothetical protein VD767_00695, partial [Thermomicrobiales bacterium]|nr:hypothetical protein [Thermomicrobiales bacterium]